MINFKPIRVPRSPVWQKGYFIVLFVSYLFCIGCQANHGINQEITKDPKIQEITQKISTKNLLTNIKALQDFQTRYPYNKQQDVAEYLFKELSKYNLDVDYHVYEYWGVPWRNVVATLPRKDHPEEIIIICAHYDSKSDKQLALAPGADDNASGTSAVLEIARVLSNYEFKKTIKFILFSNEEIGQKGSESYVRDAVKQKENIVAAINLDMIAYGDKNEDMDIVTQPKHRWLAEYISNISSLYSDLKIRKVIDKRCF